MSISIENLVLTATHWIKQAAWTGDEDEAVEGFLGDVERQDARNYREGIGERVKAAQRAKKAYSTERPGGHRP